MLHANKFKARGAVLVVSGLLMLAPIAPAHAVPYIPADGAQIIERLPSRSDPAQQEFKRLGARLAAAPDDVRLAAELARRYIEQARSEGDPRYLGYAQAALAPWWKQQRPPVEVLILRATLLQSTHQFPQALLDLDTVLRADRDKAQAWLTRATILLVQGEYAQAMTSCERLYPLAPELITQTCLANIASVNGHAAQSYAALKQALTKHPDADPGIRIWVLTLLAEMAARNGDSVAADRHFQDALSIDRTDSYLLGAYADFLLDQKRPSDVVTLLKGKTRVDALLLRYTLALKAIESPATSAETEVLRARFRAAMLRGDTVHQREQARFVLRLENDPKTAVSLAQLNWAVQKEPADVRVFLEAAAAANDRAAAQPVLDWLRKTGLEDRALVPAMAKLNGGN